MTIPPILPESVAARPTPPTGPKNIIQAMRENLAALREQGASQEEMEQEIAMWARKVRNQNDAEMFKAEVADAVSPAFMSALDAGTFGLTGLAVDAASPGSFRANRDARQAVYSAMPTSDRLLSSLAGGIANPAGRLLKPAARGASTIANVARTAGRGAVEGAAQGALTGFGENVGTTEGVTKATIQGAAGGAIGGAVLSPLAAAIGSRFARTPELMPDVPERSLRDVLAANALDTPNITPTPAPTPQTGRLTPQVAPRTPVPQTPPNTPERLSVDVAGPNLRATTRGATGTVAGRESLRGPFEAREAQAIPAVTAGVPDALAIDARLQQARSRMGSEMYADAAEATKGVGVDDPTIDAFLQTPTGQKAWEAVQRRRPDLVFGKDDPTRNLPLVEHWKGPELVDRQVPDAEAVHEMKRQLAEWANLDPNQAQALGVDAIAAKNALEGFQRVRESVAPEFRAADDAYSEASKEIEALTLGRTPWKANPVARPGRPDRISATAAERRMSTMSPGERVNVQTGKQSDLASRLHERKTTIPKLSEAMADPQSVAAREIAVSGLGPRIASWGPVLSRQADLLPEGQLAVGPESQSFAHRIAEAMANSPGYTAVRTGRELTSNAMSPMSPARQARDAGIGKLVTQPPETLADVLARQLAEDLRVGQFSKVGTAAAGGVSGTTDSPPKKGSFRRNRP